ncbi:hypothetical protein C8J57DRAFT_1531353 [Mycena rebaudengoi]|nr:hypothetical protein C8J57DRAFT_1531353 [Mycena rebaudengoi]
MINLGPPSEKSPHSSRLPPSFAYFPSAGIHKSRRLFAGGPDRVLHVLTRSFLHAALHHFAYPRSLSVPALSPTNHTQVDMPRGTNHLLLVARRHDAVGAVIVTAVPRRLCRPAGDPVCTPRNRAYLELCVHSRVTALLLRLPPAVAVAVAPFFQPTLRRLVNPSIARRASVTAPETPGELVATPEATCAHLRVRRRRPSRRSTPSHEFVTRPASAAGASLVAPQPDATHAQHVVRHAPLALDLGHLKRSILSRRNLVISSSAL